MQCVPLISRTTNEGKFLEAPLYTAGLNLILMIDSTRNNFDMKNMNTEEAAKELGFSAVTSLRDKQKEVGRRLIFSLF